MQNKLFNSAPRIAICIFLVVVLALIRAFEEHLFYDPFSHYFESEYLSKPFPEFELWRLTGSIALRYALNMVVSIAILYVLFKDLQILKFSALLYVVFFILLLSGFLVILVQFDSRQNFFLFYIRRFLIQPLFLLLFVPAFYYQLRLSKK